MPDERSQAIRKAQKSGASALKALERDHDRRQRALQRELDAEKAALQAEYDQQVSEAAAALNQLDAKVTEEIDGVDGQIQMLRRNFELLTLVNLVMKAMRDEIKRRTQGGSPVRVHYVMYSTRELTRMDIQALLEQSLEVTSTTLKPTIRKVTRKQSEETRAGTIQFEIEFTLPPF